MRIAVNARLLVRDRYDGIGVFTAECLKRICRLHPEHEFIFLFDRPYASEFIFSSNITPVVLPPPTRHPFLWWLWLARSLPQMLGRIRPQLFISTDGFLPLRGDIPSVAVIHDLNFEHYPGDLPVFSRWFYRRYFPVFARKAVRIATVSRFSANDISGRYNIPPDRIDVVYNGASEHYLPLDPVRRQEMRDHLTGGEEYLIFIGNLHPRKNVARLVQAFDRFLADTGLPFRLVIVGEKYFMTREITLSLGAMKERERVIFTGPMMPQDLAKVLAAAHCLVFVPYFEGFGIPILEAMQCDIPVVCSNVTSMPEIAGDAALLADPFSVASIAAAMTRVTTETGLREKLIEKGRINRIHYSWDKTADLLWKTIEQCL